MYQGKLNKARRGELLGVPPIGYVRLASGEWAIDPDEQVQATVRLIFDQFDREDDPARPAPLPGPPRGPHPGPVEPRPEPGRAGVAAAEPGDAVEPAAPPELRRGLPVRPPAGRPAPQAAGAADHRQADPPAGGVPGADPRPAAGVHHLGPVPVPTRSDSTPTGPGTTARRAATRASLLAGLLRCGRCGRRMIVRYSGPKNRHTYTCTRGSADYAEPLCQSLSGPVLDELVAGRVLAAVEPAALEASLAAVAGVERERAELARHWQLRRERAASRGRSRVPAVSGVRAGEPPGRPRAGAALGGGAQVPAAAGGRVRAWQRTAPGRLSADDERAIRSLAADLPAVWRAATTTPGRAATDRQALDRTCEGQGGQGQRAGRRRTRTGSAAWSSRTPCPGR